MMQFIVLMKGLHHVVVGVEALTPHDAADLLSEYLADDVYTAAAAADRVMMRGAVLRAAVSEAKHNLKQFEAETNAIPEEG